MNFSKITHSIKVSVRPVYLEEQSSPDEHYYVWAYYVRIENLSDDPVQLINRYWRITDAKGRTQEIKGPGVVGEQPVLNPGSIYEYASGTPLNTPSGFMVGDYEMENEKGESFQVAIPAFSLDAPFERICLH
jgi:ApaG protein